MAWNNVRNEPKREWIEQGFGLLAVVLYGVFVYYIVQYCGGLDHGPKAMPIALQYILAALLIGLGCALLFIISVGGWYLAHEIGEFACALLTGMGWDPRPNPRENRYR